MASKITFEIHETTSIPLDSPANLISKYYLINTIESIADTANRMTLILTGLYVYMYIRSPYNVMAIAFN